MKSHTLKIFTLTLLLVMMATACGRTPAGPPETDSEPVVEEVIEPTEEPTSEPAAPEPVELTFWFEGAALGTLEIFQESFDRYQALNPHVTIEVVPMPFEDMLRTLPLAIDGGTGPDIATVPPLDSITFREAQAGHLYDLTQVAEERNWLEGYDPKAIEVNNAGLGGIYGIPYEWTVVGVYYNKEIFANHGLEPPTTFAEFEALLATLSDAGITPISVGGRDGWPLSHVWQELVHTNVEYSVLRALEDKDPNASYDHPALIEAAAKMVEWSEAGYLDPNLLSTSFVDANNLFINGEAAMNVGGTWVQADFRGAPFEVGFFPMPRMRTDIDPHLGGFTPYNDFVIIKNSDNLEAAVDLLDYLLSEENMSFWWEKGLLVPYRFDTVPEGVDELQHDIYAAMQANGPGHFITVSAPETNRVLWAAMQEMVDGAKTPEEAFAEIQDAYVKEVSGE